MRRLKMISCFLAAFIVLFLLGCESRIFNRGTPVYSSLGGIDKVFNLNDNYYTMGHLSVPIIDCSSLEFPKCLIFGSTVIMLPEISIFDKIEDGYYEGRNESLDLDYTLKKTEIVVLGQKVKGYMFYVAHPYEMINGETMLGKLKGAYFYSMSDGILFYEHNSEIILSNQGKDRLSVINWSTKKCGFFATDCK